MSLFVFVLFFFILLLRNIKKCFETTLLIICLSKETYVLWAHKTKHDEVEHFTTRVVHRFARQQTTTNYNLSRTTYVSQYQKETSTI